jgi:hypothetical protein
MTETLPVNCSFYIRTPVEGEQFKYEPVNISSPAGNGGMTTPYPPAAGDLIQLWDSIKETGGVYRVLVRRWMHSSYGSANWPYGKNASTVGPHLEVIVEAAVGPFVDEAEPDETEE